jgi:hypothetical protein
MGVTIHILSDRRLPISNSPVAAVPLLPRSGFVQSCVNTKMTGSSIKALNRMGGFI